MLLFRLFFQNSKEYYVAAAGGAAYHNYAHILAAIQDKKLNCQLEDVSRQFGMISLQVIALRPDQIMSIVKHTLLLNYLKKRNVIIQRIRR